MAADRWTPVIALAAGVLVFEASLGGFATYLLWRPTQVDVPSWCNAGVNGFSCSFTNANTGRVFGNCQRGILTPKRGGKPVESMALCSGTIESRETKTVEVPFQGKVTEACHDEHGLIDFGSCELSVVAVP